MKSPTGPRLFLALALLALAAFLCWLWLLVLGRCLFFRIGFSLESGHLLFLGLDGGCGIGHTLGLVSEIVELGASEVKDDELDSSGLKEKTYLALKMKEPERETFCALDRSALETRVMSLIMVLETLKTISTPVRATTERSLKLVSNP